MGKFTKNEVIGVINSADIGVYLKEFNSPIGDASTMVKVSEYLACAKPVLFPEMDGVKEQTGEAGMILSNGIAIALNSFAFSKKLLEPFSEKARNQAIKKLDLNKNLDQLKLFLEKVIENE